MRQFAGAIKCIHIKQHCFYERNLDGKLVPERPLASCLPFLGTRGYQQKTLVVFPCLIQTLLCIIRRMRYLNIYDTLPNASAALRCAYAPRSPTSAHPICVPFSPSRKLFLTYEWRQRAAR